MSNKDIAKKLNANYGALLLIKNGYTEGVSYLDANGGNSQKGSTTWLDVVTDKSNNRAGKCTSVWKVIPEKNSNKKINDTISYGDSFYIENQYSEGVSYLDANGGNSQKGSTTWLDVVTDKSNNRAGKCTSVWKLIPTQDSNKKLGDDVSIGDRFYIENQYSEGVSYLDANGGNSQKGSTAWLDVVTDKSKDRSDMDTSVWSFESKGSMSQYPPEVPPHSLKVERVQCVIPSGGTAGLQAFETGFGIVGAALATVAFTIVTGGITVGTAGAGAPVGAAIGALMWVEMEALSLAIGAAAQKGGVEFGHSLPDQVYIKIDGQKVWPSTDEFHNMNAGDAEIVNVIIDRGKNSIIKVEVCEKDVFLKDDVLMTYEVRPNDECVNLPITAVNEKEGSHYIIYLTVTLNRSSTEILNSTSS